MANPLKLALTFTDGDANLEIKVIGDKMTIRRPTGESNVLEAVAKGIVNSGADAKKNQRFIEQGKCLAVMQGEERCG